MHVASLITTLPLDPNPNPNPNWNWILQVIITLIIIGLGFIHLLRSTASKFLLLHPNFYSSSNNNSTTSFSGSKSSSNTMESSDRKCAVCNSYASKHCGGCRVVFYCSFDCQSNHWKTNHKNECQSLAKKPRQQTKPSMGIALVPTSGPEKKQKVVDKVLFPYDEFVKLYDWDKPIFPPCGLLNCGNSCFANVVLQCLVHTRPLLEYLLGKGHRRYCKKDGWCFLCELECFMTSVSNNPKPFSPVSILSRLRSIGGNLGYGDQEDAHEFMRFSIGAMQSVCLDEHGGEKVIDPKSQETTLIQHIFGGQLRSQVICTRCNQVSNQFENMMDLTVEIQGDATSLQECLDQFTSKEWLHGENMYRCDGCKDYVRAWKRLTIHQAPNVLTIALKRFQSGRFGKINKKIYFPEILDLNPYMNEERDGMDIYKLYAVIVHVDMLNASFFGHYICYTKGYKGDWYRMDDYKVTRVELDEVLSQGAYMLLYRRISARPQCLKTFKPEPSPQENGEKLSPVAKHSSTNLPDDSSRYAEPSGSNGISVNVASDAGRQMNRVDRVLEDSQTVIPVSGLHAVGEVLGIGDDLRSIAESSNQVPDIPSSSSVTVDNKEDLEISLFESSGTTKESEEHLSDYGPLVAGNTQCSAVATNDQTALCVKKDTEVGDHLGKVESEGFPDQVEMKSVEVNGSEHVSNGFVDESLPNGLDAPPEKLPCGHD